MQVEAVVATRKASTWTIFRHIGISESLNVSTIEPWSTHGLCSRPWASFAPLLFATNSAALDRIRVQRFPFCSDSVQLPGLKLSPTYDF